ncbi:MAG: LytTR family transcriptional regulator DNA-binding domain-containing protein [Arcicella sp.]|jgi:DNA-binding LytR/AlgR family response regulator|nr:LytTR family transcriptional regulator DNA-binding domain-containing protein [Arcicella sp.]
MSNLLSNRDTLLTVDSKRNIALFIDRIIMLKGEGNYTLFHLRDGKAKMYAHCLNTYEEVLRSKGFLRVHKSFMVNPQYVIDYNCDDNQLVMENNLTASVSRRRKSVLKEV